MSYTSWWPENGHCTNFFFSPPHTVTRLISIIWFTSLHITFAGWCVMIYVLAQCHDQSRKLHESSSPSDVHLQCQTWPIMLHPCQPASYKCDVCRSSSSCCHCSRAAPPEWINLTRFKLAWRGWAFFVLRTWPAISCRACGMMGALLF